MRIHVLVWMHFRLRFSPLAADGHRILLHQKPYTIQNLKHQNISYFVFKAYNVYECMSLVCVCVCA